MPEAAVQAYAVADVGSGSAEEQQRVGGQVAFAAAEAISPNFDAMNEQLRRCCDAAVAVNSGVGGEGGRAEVAVRLLKFTVALSHSPLAGAHIPCGWAHGRLWSAPTSGRRESIGSPGTLNPWHRSIDCC